MSLRCTPVDNDVEVAPRFVPRIDLCNWAASDHLSNAGPEQSVWRKSPINVQNNISPRRT